MVLRAVIKHYIIQEFEFADEVDFVKVGHYTGGEIGEPLKTSADALEAGLKLVVETLDLRFKGLQGLAVLADVFQNSAQRGIDVDHHLSLDAVVGAGHFGGA